MNRQQLHDQIKNLDAKIAEREKETDLMAQMRLLLKLQQLAIDDKQLKLAAEFSKHISACERSIAAKEIRESEWLSKTLLERTGKALAYLCIDVLVGSDGIYPALQSGELDPRDKGHPSMAGWEDKLEILVARIEATIRGLKNDPKLTSVAL